ncbi:MAG: hypothetical protein IPG58_11325 [Acidobacteria bacterium]|nr:hypothetical protein [Acidobacteriota bacterium]
MRSGGRTLDGVDGLPGVDQPEADGTACLLIVARSSAGKSALQDALCAFVPPEELVRVTRLTGQALFYKDPYSLQRKMLVIAEDEGAMQAVYSRRTLASDQEAFDPGDPGRTRRPGKLSTEHYEVFGPVVSRDNDDLSRSVRRGDPQPLCAAFDERIDRADADHSFTAAASAQSFGSAGKGGIGRDQTAASPPKECSNRWPSSTLLSNI